MSSPQLPQGYSIRRTTVADYEHGILDTLAALTTVGSVSKEQFKTIVEKWDKFKLENGKHVYNPIVITDSKERVVATGMVFIEEKIIHGAGLVGHIEDIAVSKAQQGKQLGKILINELTKIGREIGVYKIILDCDPKNVGFYEKCNYKEAGVEMSIRFDR